MRWIVVVHKKIWPHMSMKAPERCSHCKSLILTFPYLNLRNSKRQRWSTWGPGDKPVKRKKKSTQQNTLKPNCAIKTPPDSLLLHLSCLHFTALIIKPLKRKLCWKWQSHANLKTQIKSVCRVTNVCNVWRFSAMRFKLLCIVLCNLVTRVLLTVWFTFKAQLELEQRRGTSTVECVSHTVHTPATGKLSFLIHR